MAAAKSTMRDLIADIYKEGVWAGSTWPHEYVRTGQATESQHNLFRTRVNNWLPEDRQAFLSLQQTLLSFAGSAVVPMLDPGLADILPYCSLMEGEILFVRGIPNECHENAGVLAAVSKLGPNDKRVHCSTGYALSQDGLWRQHSWCFAVRPWGHLIVETTEPRLLYWGVAKEK